VKRGKEFLLSSMNKEKTVEREWEREKGVKMTAYDKKYFEYHTSYCAAMGLLEYSYSQVRVWDRVRVTLRVRAS
jgi:hypothetical protein